MRESFKDKDGNLLEKGVLYELPPLSWPLSFQGYEHRQEGDFKVLEAFFWDFKGYPHYFNKKKIESIATKTTPQQIVQYINSARTLVEWLSIKETKIARSSPKLTKSTEEYGCPSFASEKREDSKSTQIHTSEGILGSEED